MHKDYQGLRVANTDPRFDEWFDEERGTGLEEEYSVFDEVDEEDRPDYE